MPVKLSPRRIRWRADQVKPGAGGLGALGRIGRTDLPGGDGKQILRSIRDKLLPLPQDAVVIPGHGDSTTMGREKEFNYFLQRL